MRFLHVLSLATLLVLSAVATEAQARACNASELDIARFHLNRQVESIVEQGYLGGSNIRSRITGCETSALENMIMAEVTITWNPLLRVWSSDEYRINGGLSFVYNPANPTARATRVRWATYWENSLAHQFRRDSIVGALVVAGAVVAYCVSGGDC